MAARLNTDSAGPNLPRPSRSWDWLIGVVCWLGMVIFALHACTHMVAAGDTWVAMACGRHFVNHGVDTVEPFSANSHRPGPTPEQIASWPGWARWIAEKVGIETVRRWHPTGWINQNWLTHVIFYWLTTTLGSQQEPYFDALVFWKVAIYLLSVVCIYVAGRLLGAHRLLAATFASGALFIGRSFLDIRPAGFSNLLVAVFVLILILATYRQIWYLWLLVPLTVFWANVHGGYIYVFIMMIPFVLANLVAIPFKSRLVSIGWRGICHALAVYVVAFTAMVLLNPYHLTNLTHTFEISISKHAERWRNVHEWHPAFAWDNPVGTAVPFLVMYVLAWLVLILWFVAHNWAARQAIPFMGRPKRRTGAGPYQWPRIDLGLWVVAALTIYMAIRSRRFIPIAAFAACPVLASMIDQIIRAALLGRCLKVMARPDPEGFQSLVADIAAKGVMIVIVMVGFYFWPRLLEAAVPTDGGTLSKGLAWFSQWWFGSGRPNILLIFLVVLVGVVWFWLGAARPSLDRPGQGRFDIGILARTVVAGFVLGFGTWAGLRYKVVYMDPWAADPVFASVFMRMTASFLKPFEACQFIRQNHLSGKMMNYWTEGGFIAWGQEPDPKTGKTPLQLFMDGRAQAAYNVSAFDEWSYIWGGGKPMEEILASGRKIGPEDYKQIGQWITQRLRSHEVWVALIPAQQFDSVFARGLEASGQWPVVYLDNKQKLYVDINSPQGRDLFDGVLSGKTVYPDQFLTELNMAFHLLAYQTDPNAKAVGLEHAIKAYRLQPTPMPMLLILGPAARNEHLRPAIRAFCQEVCQDFQANRHSYRTRHGYRARLEAVRLASDWLASVAASQDNLEAAKSYAEAAEQYRQERDLLTDLQRW